MKNTKIDLSYMDLFKSTEIDLRNMEQSTRLLLQYENYLSKIETLNDKKENFTNRILFDEILSIGNISNSQMDSLYDVLENKIDQKKELYSINSILSNIENNNSAIGIRNKNNYVGAYDYQNNCSIVKFENIDIIYIETLLEEIIKLYIENYNKPEDIMIKPIIVSAMISLFQCFNDGNTRTSNLVRNIKIWRETNTFFDVQNDIPILYNYTLNTSEQLIRDMRCAVIDIALYKNMESLNGYINKVLTLMENEISYQTNNISNYSRR